MSPMNRALYPIDWQVIARAAKDRAGWRCEQCGVPHNAIGFRDQDGKFVHEDSAPRFGGRLVKIVLTTAHLDHNPTNNDPSNLRAYCQQCHNRHDVAFRQANAARTRDRKRGQIRMEA